MTGVDLAPVVLGHRFPDHPGEGRTAPDALRLEAREMIEAMAAVGVVHAEIRLCPVSLVADELTFDALMAAVHEGADAASAAGCEAHFVIAAPTGLDEAVAVDLAELAERWAKERVVGFAAPFGGAGRARAFAVAAQAGLGLCLDGPGPVRAGGGSAGLSEALRLVHPDRLGPGWRLVDGCTVENDRVVALDPTAAAVRDGGLPLESCPPGHHRLLFDAGFRLTGYSGDTPFTPVERDACTERAALATFLPSAEKAALVAEVADGAVARPARLVHLAARDRWEAARARGVYLPAEWEQDGFIHLSAPHQVLTPANRFYRSREDLVAVVVDAHLLGSAVVWEAGTGTLERFPHLYGALPPDAVLGEVPILPQPDGGFLLPERLLRALRSPLGG